jgi:hypothetical protein
MHNTPTAVRHSRVTAKTSSNLRLNLAVEYKPLARLKPGPKNRRPRIERDLAFVDAAIRRQQVFTVKTVADETSERYSTESHTEIEHERSH